ARNGRRSLSNACLAGVPCRVFTGGVTRVPSRREVALRYARHYWTVLCEAERLYHHSADAAQCALEMCDLDWANIHKWHEWTVQHAEDDAEVAALCERYAADGAGLLLLRELPADLLRWFDKAATVARRLGNQAAEAQHIGNL